MAGEEEDLEAVEVSAAAGEVPPVAAREEAGSMKIEHFLSNVDHASIHQAIKSAEQGTSGDIVLFISHRKVEDPLSAANNEFKRLGLETATNRNSLLIFLAPKSRKFAVVGGTALHDKVGQVWWDKLIAVLGSHFKEGRYTEGLLVALEQAGQALKAHFPDQAPDRTGQHDIVEQ
jgi:uncharacterized membrane protein